MKTLSQEEFEKLYGTSGVSSFASQKKDVGFMKDTGQDIVQTGKNLATTAKETFGQGGTVSKALDAGVEGKQGLLRSFAQAFGAGASGVAKGIGNLFTGAVKTALPQGGEDFAKEALKTTATPVVQSVLEIPVVKNWLADYQSLPEAQKRDVDALFGIGSLATELATIPFAGSLGKKTISEAVDLGISGAKKTGQAIRGAVDSVPGLVKPLSGAVDTAKDLATGVGRSIGNLPSKIATNVAVKQEAIKAVESLPTAVARKTASMGVDVADVNTLVRIPATQKTTVKKLYESVKSFANGTSKVRPEEVVGKPITQALKRMDSLKGQVGQKLGVIADTLGNVTTKEVFEPVFNQLKKVPGLSGLKVSKKGVLDFSDTVLTTAETAGDRKAIQSMFVSAVKNGTGKQKHLLRQELFEILGGKKGSLANLTATQERAYEAVRKGLADVLDTKNSTYKALNQQYAQISKPLSDLRKMMKASGATDADILDMSAGLLARRLTSNAASNPQLRTILRAIDTQLGKGGKTLVNIENLQDVYNVLDKYYDIAAKTGFQGQIKNAVSSSGGIMEKITGAIGSVAGETPAVRQKAIEELLDSILK